MADSGIKSRMGYIPWIGMVWTREETIMADQEFIGIRKEKISDLVSALLCAAVGMLFVNIGLKKYYIMSYDPIYQVTHILFFDPLVLAST